MAAIQNRPVCAQCKKALRVATRHFEIRQGGPAADAVEVEGLAGVSILSGARGAFVYDPQRVVRDRAQCEAMSEGGKVLAVRKLRGGVNHGAVRSWTVWDGRTYRTVGGYFCEAACAIGYAQNAHRDRLGF